MVELKGWMEKNEGSGGNTRCSLKYGSQVWLKARPESRFFSFFFNAMSIKLNKRVVLHYGFTRDVQNPH